jgi:hypothetical protein
MRAADTDFPFDRMNRVAVIGGGKSALCAAESLLGISPSSGLRTVADGVPRVDLYAIDLPTTRGSWMADVPRRYARLASHLPNGDLHHDLTVRQMKAPDPVNVPGGVLLGGDFYDMVIVAAGRSAPPPLDDRGYQLYSPGATGSEDSFEPVSRRSSTAESYRIGPVTNLPWTDQERAAGIPGRYPDNKVAMFRLAPRTAALAAALPLSGQPVQ